MFFFSCTCTYVWQVWTRLKCSLCHKTHWEILSWVSLVGNMAILTTALQWSVKNICTQEKFINRLIFNLGLASAHFLTTCPCLQQVNLTCAHDRTKNQQFVSGPLQKNMTSMSSKLKPAIWSCDTGQRILCFDRCQLTITWMSSIKEWHYKPRLCVSVNLLAGVWPSSCTTLSPSPLLSWVCTHKQYC